MKIVSTYEEIAVHLDAIGERHMALMVRNQTDALTRARAANEKLLREFYQLRERYEPTPPRPTQPVWTGD